MKSSSPKPSPQIPSRPPRGSEQTLLSGAPDVHAPGDASPSSEPTETPASKSDRARSAASLATDILTLRGKHISSRSFTATISSLNCTISISERPGHPVSYLDVSLVCRVCSGELLHRHPYWPEKTNKVHHSWSDPCPKCEAPLRYNFLAKVRMLPHPVRAR